MAIFTDEGREDELDDVIVRATDWRLGMYKNTPTLSNTTVLADLTECDYSGYARQTPTWGAITLDGAHLATSAGDPKTFNHSGGATANAVHGWFIVDTGSGKLKWAEDFAAPRSMGLAGDEITITPTLFMGPLP